MRMPVAMQMMSGLVMVLGLLGMGGSRVNASQFNLTPTKEYTNTSEVWDIEITEHGVWAATGGGLIAVDKQTLNERHRITSKVGLFGNALRTLMQMEPGVLWVGGDFGQAMVTVDGTEKKAVVKEVKRHSQDRFDPIVDFVTIDHRGYALHFQTGLTPLNETTGKMREAATKGNWNTGGVNGNRVALGASDGTFWVVDQMTGKKIELLRFASPVVKVAAYLDGFLVATQAELYRYRDGIAHMERRSSGKNSVAVQATCLTAVSRNRVLLGTADGMILEYTKDGIRELTRVEGGRITAIEPDGTEIWMGVSQRGLARYSTTTKEMTFVRDEAEICSNHVTQSLYHGDTLVVRTFDNGVCYLSGRGWKQLKTGKSVYVHGLASDGNTLVVADSNGITLFDEQLTPVDESRYATGSMRWLAQSAALSVVSPKQGLFFIASPFGIARVKAVGDAYKTTFWKKARGIPKDITALAADSELLYIGTESRGVRVFTQQGKFVTDYLDPSYLPEAWIMALGVSNAGLYVGTCQHGMAWITHEGVTYHTTATGLADNRIIAAEPFQNGAFVAGLQGLSFVDGTHKGYRFTAIPVPDQRSASVAVFDNTLLYGTESGLIIYQIHSL